MKEDNLSDDIENLLSQYLNLVDEYDLLRRRLYMLQVSARQNLARANFNAARGIRYGEELYDSRMQALRLCCVTVDAEKGKRKFTVITKDTIKKKSDPSTASEVKEGALDGLSQEKTMNGDGQTTEDTAITIKHDPIRMFGILTPTSLRLVQTDSIKMVNIIPRLVELDAELAQIELEIRRLRKRRTKTEPNVKKSINQSQPT
ncbi:hypothetical protein OnM2_020059 [Erysiphe neolycopersici]|uniref:Vacuolar ATPase assembly protein VMA22 n=1 Tax=Erysiphe neolycopersici TaxID=212602 RepID=A0A420I3A9_9PEZI|nr:hypothetical protein OnM2_020059 [Erysiphe neolycopersici]